MIAPIAASKDQGNRDRSFAEDYKIPSFSNPFFVILPFGVGRPESAMSCFLRNF